MTDRGKRYTYRRLSLRTTLLSHMLCVVLVLGNIFALCKPVRASQENEKRDSAAKPQAQRDRKSITYLGIFPKASVKASGEEISLVEKIVRSGIESKAFNYIPVDRGEFESIEAFAVAVQIHAAKRDDADRPTDIDQRLKGLDIDRIVTSTYWYKINILQLKVAKLVCPGDPISAKLQKCRPDSTRMRAKVDAEVVFYQFDPDADPPKNLEVVKRLGSHRPGIAYVPYKETIPEPQEPEAPPEEPVAPEEPQISDYATEEAWKRAKAEHKRTQETYKRALVAYGTARKKYWKEAESFRKAQADRRYELAKLKRIAELKAVQHAANDLKEILVKELSDIRLYCLSTKVSAVMNDEVKFPLGKENGVQLDDTYKVVHQSEPGSSKTIGYVKVRKVGGIQEDGEITPSSAEKIKADQEIMSGDLLVAHRMLGNNYGVHFLTEFLFQPFPFPGIDAGRAFIGAGLYIDFNLARFVGINEFYLSLEGDFLRAGKVLGIGLNLVHAMVGFKKKWHHGSLVFAVGARGGISIYLFDVETAEQRSGPGADIFFNLEYYLSPAFSIYLGLAGRLFENPLGETNSRSPNSELGATTSAGVRFGI